MTSLNYTNKDYASLRAALLELAKDKLPEGAWSDDSPNDLGVMLLELFAYMGDALFYNQDRIAGESFLETAVERRSLVQLLRLIGYELKAPLAASADLTLLFKIGSTGIANVAQFASFKTTAAVTGTPLNFQYILPTPIAIDLTTLPIGIVDANGKLKVLAPGAPVPTPLPPGNTQYFVYQTLPVVQTDANVTGEILASSDGSSGQRLALARAPIVDDTLVIRVDEGAGPVVWIRVPNLLGSNNTDTHYSVRRDENGKVWIEFGDGTYGKIPQRGSNNVTASYGVGGGTKGNVAAYAISKAVTPINQLKMVANVLASSGGADAETTADAAQRGPLLFRSMGRAVTESDYEVLAQMFGVGKVIARASSWNSISLIVAPAGGGFVSDTLKQDLLAFLDGKRIMTSLVRIQDPCYVEVIIDAVVTVLPEFSRRLVQQQVEDAVQKLLAFEAVGFGVPLYISKVYEVIQDIAGVAGATLYTFARADSFQAAQPSPSNGQLNFAGLGELPIWSGFSISGALPTPDGTSHLVMIGGVIGG